MVRAGEVIAITLTPTVIRDTNALGRYYFRPILGVTRMGALVMDPLSGSTTALELRSVELGTRRPGSVATCIEQVGKLVTGAAAVQKSLGGPVEMVRQASSAAEQGIFVWARSWACSPISLGIINLLPVPVLDGGSSSSMQSRAFAGDHSRWRFERRRNRSAFSSWCC